MYALSFKIKTNSKKFPVLLSTGERKLRLGLSSESSRTATWWNNLGSSPVSSPLLRRRDDPSCLSFTNPTAPPTSRQSPPKDDFQTGIAKQRFSIRSYSSPAGDQRHFEPLDISLSFVDFHNLPKCRPELEDVGGNCSSILSSSPEDNTSVQRTMLPTTQEVTREELSDEGKTNL